MLARTAAAGLLSASPDLAASFLNNNAIGSSNNIQVVKYRHYSKTMFTQK